jgi:putative oxidoreductase
MKFNSTSEKEFSPKPSAMQCLCDLMKLPVLAQLYRNLANALNQYSNKVPPLLLRLILAYEFWEAGIMKYEGDNWFDQLTFPFPFNLFSSDWLWMMSTWLELGGAIALAIGFGTRLFTLAMMILTVVAINTVHWPAEWHSLGDLNQGYAITDSGHGNFKLPLIYLILFTPLLFGGAGKWSLDYLLKRMLYKNEAPM